MSSLTLNRKSWLCLLILTGLAFCLRIWGLDFGLPNESRPDENHLLVSVIYHILQPAVTQGDLSLNPNFLYHPSLFLYLSAFLEYLLFTFMGGDWQGFTLHFESGDALIYLVPRLISVVAGALFVPVMFFIGRELKDDRLGWFAAGFAAVCYFAVRNAHFGTPDALHVLFVALAILFMLRRQHVAMAVVTGLALGTKYQAVALLLPLAYVLWLDKSGWNACLKIFGIALLTFIVTTPWAVFAPAQFVEHLMYGVRAQSASLPGAPPGWWFYPAFALFYGLGIQVFAASLAGFYEASRQFKREQYVLLLVVFFAFFLPLAAHHTVMTRYALPLLPVLLVFAACGCDWLAGFIYEYTLKDNAVFTRHHLAFYLLVVFLFFAGAQTIQFDRILAAGDTRSVARAWLLENAREAQPVAIGPRLGQIRLPLSYGQLLLEAAPANLAPASQELQMQQADPRTRVVNSFAYPETFASWGVRYVALFRGVPLFSNPPSDYPVYDARAKKVFVASPLKDNAPMQTPTPENPRPYLYEPLDAFFLPYANLNEFTISGPEITIYELPPPVSPQRRP